MDCSHLTMGCRDVQDCTLRTEPATVCPHGSQPRPPERDDVGSDFSTPSATVGEDSGFFATPDCTVGDDSDRSDIAADLQEKVRAGGCPSVSDVEGMRTDADEAISEDSSGCGSTLITSSTDDGVSRAEAHMRATLDGEREQCDDLRAVLRAGHAVMQQCQNLVARFLRDDVDFRTGDPATIVVVFKDLILAFKDLSSCLSAMDSVEGARSDGLRLTRAERQRRCDVIVGCTARVEQLLGQLWQW